MKNYHKILLVALFALVSVGTQAQTSLFRVVNDQSNLAITMKENPGGKHLVGLPRSGANDLSQFFILHKKAGYVTIQSAANPDLYLSRNSNNYLVFAVPANANDANIRWSVDFAGIGNKSGAIGYCVLSLPEDHTRLAMINSSGEFEVVAVMGGLPAGQERKFRFLLEKKNNTF